MADENKKNEQSVEPKPQETPKESPLTVEQLQAQIKALQDTIEKQKKATSAACADAAEWKRQYRATLDETTRKEQEKADELTSIKEQLQFFRDKDRVNTYASKLIEAGFSVEQANKMASALPEGISDAFFETQKSYLEAQKQQIKTQALNSQPNLPVGEAPSTNDSKKIEEAKYRGWFGLK